MDHQIIYWQTLKQIPNIRFLGQHTLRFELGECSKQELQQYEQLFDIESWYETFSGLTFPTLFLDVSLAEAAALLRRYVTVILCDHDPWADDAPFRHTLHGYPASQDDVLLASLRERITLQMQRISPDVSPSSQFFIRLSSRSPKDSAYGTSKMKSLLRAQLAGLTDSSWRQNAEYAAFFRAQIAALCVSDAAVAIEMLSRSERIFTDLQAVLPGSHLPPPKLAIRRWCDSLDIAGEFRCFVHRREITAISQYYEMVCFPLLLRFCDDIRTLIATFFEERVRHLLPWDDCVMDVVVDFGSQLSAEQSSSDIATLSWSPHAASVQIIEFNPFTKYTSGALFSWTHPHDSQVIHGQLPFEFRVLKTPMPDLGRRTTAQDFQSRLSKIDSALFSESSALLSLVQEHLEDDFDRINSSLRYSMRNKLLEKAMNSYRYSSSAS